MRVLGAILAGGQATRFGSDKALAVLDGRPLIAHAAAMLDGFVAQTVVCGRDVAPDGMTVIADWPAAQLGPLGGLCAALRHAAAHGWEAVLSIGCDMPVVPPAVLERLTTGVGARFVRQAPIVGYWPVALAEPLGVHLLRDGDRSVRRWAMGAGAEQVDAGGELPNVNRAGDLAAFEKATPWP